MSGRLGCVSVCHKMASRWRRAYRRDGASIYDMAVTLILRSVKHDPCQTNKGCGSSMYWYWCRKGCWIQGYCWLHSVKMSSAWCVHFKNNCLAMSLSNRHVESVWNLLVQRCPWKMMTSQSFQKRQCIQHTWLLLEGFSSPVQICFPPFSHSTKLERGKLIFKRFGAVGGQRKYTCSASAPYRCNRVKTYH